MQAVILASGQGSRVGYKTKPLLKVAGRKIIDRTIILLKPYINEFIFIVREDNTEIEEYLKSNWSKKIKYTIIKNPIPERGNGYTLYLAHKHVKDRFVLTMGDHVYSKEFIDKAIKKDGLIGDFKPKYVDVREATKVKVRNGKVEDIGKKLKDFDCLDTGFFILDAKIFDVAEKIVEKKYVVELSEIIKELKPKVSNVSGEFWMDIDTPEELKKAKKLLVKLSIKSKGDGFISRNINRKISTRISELLVDYISPNQATFLAFTVGILASIVTLWNIQIAGLTYQLSSIIDGIDGEIARASLKSSKFGEWIDSVLDRYVDFFFILAVVYVIYSSISKRVIIVALFALIGSVMVSYTTEKFKASYNKNAYICIRELKYLPGKRDERIFIIMIFCVLRMPIVMLYVIALLTNLRVSITAILVHIHSSELE